MATRPVVTDTTTVTTVYTNGVAEEDSRKNDEMSFETLDNYLGPTSKVNTVFNAQFEEINIDFDATFPSLGKEDNDIFVTIRRMNSVVFEVMSGFIHVVFSFVFGLLSAILCGFFMGMTRTFYTYLAGPMIKWINIFISMMAPSWKSFSRAFCDPFFESLSIMFSNVQVRMGMEANARYKSIKESA